MASNEKTGPKVASKGTNLLSEARVSVSTKPLAGSVLSQRSSKKPPTARATASRSKVLIVNSDSKSARSQAGSVSTQRSGTAFPVKSFAVFGSSLSKAERSAAVRKAAMMK